MGDKSRHYLEEVWKQRCAAAKLRLELAIQRVREMEEQRISESLPAPDGGYAYRQALRAEQLAIREYSERVAVYTNLKLHGIVPDED